MLLVLVGIATTALMTIAPGEARADFIYSRYCQGKAVIRCVEVHQRVAADGSRKVRFKADITDNAKDDANYWVAFSKITVPAASGGTRTFTDYDGWASALDIYFTPETTCPDTVRTIKINYTAYFTWKNAAGHVTASSFKQTVGVCGPFA
ncbi:hypothetical protein BCD48_28100 [Pseudofrankia sp. BMG5.36]|nr:hypothetical protein BCD48_28100 [Pseudofrankia sp. BMG5.36]